MKTLRNSFQRIFCTTLSSFVVLLTVLLWLAPSAPAQELRIDEQIPLVLNPPPVGTFYLVQDKHSPPYPFDPSYGQWPVYQLRPGVFLVDDSQVDYVSLRAWQKSDLEKADGGKLMLSSTGPEGYAAAYSSYNSNDLWLELLPGPTNFTLVLHNTQTGSVYKVRSRADVATGAWNVFTNVPGATGTNTFVPVSNSLAALFFWVANDSPTATNHAYEPAANSYFQVPAGSGLLTGASDPNGDGLVVTLVSLPGHGTITALNTNDGSFTYLSASNYVGADSFTYVVFDGAASSAPATVTLTIQPNAPPVATGGSFFGFGYCATNVSALAFDPDGDALFFVYSNHVTSDYFYLAAFDQVECQTLCGANAVLEYRVYSIDAYGQIQFSKTNWVHFILSAQPYVPPTVSLSSPTNDSLSTEHAVVLLTAQPTDFNHCAPDFFAVNYYSGTNLLGTSTIGPSYACHWTNPPVGTYQVTAVASLIFAGLSGTSAPVTITIETDADWDGISDRQELLDDTGTNDYYNGVLPGLHIAGGNYQSAAPGATLPVPLQVSVASATGSPLHHAPVTFSVPASGGSLLDPANGQWTTNVLVRADAAGLASISYRLPQATNTLVTISASVATTGGTRSVTFMEASTTSPGTGSASMLEVFTPLE